MAILGRNILSGGFINHFLPFWPLFGPFSSSDPSECFKNNTFWNWDTKTMTKNIDLWMDLKPRTTREALWSRQHSPLFTMLSNHDKMLTMDIVTLQSSCHDAIQESLHTCNIVQNYKIPPNTSHCYKGIPIKIVRPYIWALPFFFFFFFVGGV